jgi:hypothetical protein
MSSYKKEHIATCKKLMEQSDCTKPQMDNVLDTLSTMNDEQVEAVVNVAYYVATIIPEPFKCS